MSTKIPKHAGNMPHVIEVIMLKVMSYDISRLTHTPLGKSWYLYCGENGKK
jgi:hypothetical protein